MTTAPPENSPWSKPIRLPPLGLLFVVFNEVLAEQVLPLSNDLIPDDFTNKSEIVAQNNLWMNYWMLTPIVCFAVVCIYLIVEAVGSSGN